jgi:large subunit ribosomal protein L2
MKRAGGRNFRGTSRPVTRVAVTSVAIASSTSSGRSDEVPAKVAAVEYDPNRTARIALIHYADGEKRLHPRAEQPQVGDTVTGRARPSTSGAWQRDPAEEHPRRHVIHNIELRPGKRRADGPHGGWLGAADGEGRRVRAGASAFLRVRRKVLAAAWRRSGSWATSSTRTSHRQGRQEPLARGSPDGSWFAMNPVDHPHGGGEGKSKGQGNPHPVTPGARRRRVSRTRKNKRTDKFIVSPDAVRASGST